MDSLFNKFKHALQGLNDAFHDKSVLLQLLIGSCVITFGLIYGFTALEWVLILCVILFVVGAEIFNTAIEILCNKVEYKQDPLIRQIKDLGAAAVLVVSMVAVIIGLAVLKGVFR